MIDRLFRRPSAVERHRRTPCGPFVDGYVHRLRREGFDAAVVRSRLHVITRFGEYLSRGGVERLADADEGVEAGFYAVEEQRLSRFQKQAELIRKVRSIMGEFLLHAGLRTGEKAPEPAVVLSALCRWLSVDRGLRPNSIDAYRAALAWIPVQVVGPYVGLRWPISMVRVRPSHQGIWVGGSWAVRSTGE